MATQQFINALRPFPTIITSPEVISPFKTIRIDVGIIPNNLSASGRGWALLGAMVRRYCTLSPEGRALVRAFLRARLFTVILVGIVIIIER